VSNSPVSDLIAALGKNRLALGIAAGQAAWPVAKAVMDWVKKRHTYSITVPRDHGGGDLYDDLQEWILSMLGTEERDSLIAYSSTSGYADDDEPRTLQLAYDGTVTRTVNIRGHKTEISVTEADPQKGKPDEICFTASSTEGRDAVIAQIAATLKAGPGKPVFKMINRWGTGWERVSDMPPRSLDSVILPPGQLERIVNDIQHFLDSERLYGHRNMPWHRAHLYEGPPGTGKTSLAKAIADHFGMDAYYLPLADVEKDAQMTRVIMEIKPKSLLLIEDIDVFSSATERKQKGKQSTLSGLLNSLDGIATPHGLVTIMTSNHPESLDPALLRPGRVDLAEHFGLAGPGEINRLVSHWYGTEVTVGLPPETRLSPASVTEICKNCQHPDDAVMDLFAKVAFLPVAA